LMIFDWFLFDMALQFLFLDSFDVKYQLTIKFKMYAYF
jgi:hypothetical protein